MKRANPPFLTGNFSILALEQLGGLWNKNKTNKKDCEISRKELKC
jgi:hypothetical protein